MNMMGLANKRLGQYPFNIFIIYDQYFYKWPIIYICMKLIAKRPYHFIIKVCIVILTRWSEEIS